MYRATTTAHTDRPPHEAEPMLRALQIGMSWGLNPAAGGLDRIYSDLVRQLPGHGIDVEGAVWGPDDVLARSGGRVHSFARHDASPLQRYRGARRVIGQLAQRGHFDIVACHFALYGALVLDHLRHQPLIVHFHGPWSAESEQEGDRRWRSRGKHMIELQVYRRADYFIVLSKAFADLLVKSYHVPEHRVFVVPGHVDLARFAVAQTREQARTQLGWPTDRPILLAVRRLARRMGLERLIEAMTSVVAAVPDVLLCIGGAGPMGEALSRQARAAGLARHVRFLGFLPESDLPLAYRAADLNVVPSRMLEGFGLVAAEALAAGTPSMVTPVGGLPEAVAPLDPGLVFASPEAADIAAGLIAALRGTIGLPGYSACRTYAEAHFSLPAAAHRIATIYRASAG